MTRSAPRLVWLFASVVLVGCRGRGAAGPVESMVVEPGPDVATTDPMAILDDFAGHEQPGLRARAVRFRVWAGGPGRPEDPSSWVQQAHVEGLALREADARAELLDVARRRDVAPWVRALAALVRPDDRMVEALGDYRAEAGAWRRIPLALGAWVSGDESAKPVVIRELRTGMLDWNVELFLAIADHGDAELLPALEVAQAAAEPELELAIAAARLQLGDAGGGVAFRRVIDGRDTEARLEALDLLVRVRSDVVDGLVARAGDRGPALVTWYAELAGIDRGATKPVRLRKAFEDPDPEVRELALRFAAPGVEQPAWRPRQPVDDKRRALGRELVERGFDDADPRVRRQALESAAMLGVAASPRARALLADPHPEVRIAAAGLLAL